MKLYDGGRAPNPRRVRIFLAEKGIDVPLVPIDMGAMGHRSQEITERNPLQRLPVIELDDGTILTESVAICRYFEELHPEPALFGEGALGKARVEMWQRRMEMHFLLTVANAFTLEGSFVFDQSTRPDFTTGADLGAAEASAARASGVLACLP